MRDREPHRKREVDRPAWHKGAMLGVGARSREVLLRGPWATLLPLLVFLPFLFSGALRFTFGIGLGMALVLLLIVGALGVAAARRFGVPHEEPAESAHAGIATMASTLVLIAVSYRLWWTPGFGGLPNTIYGTDIGTHLSIYHRFLGADYKQYEGFIGLYALMYWYAQIFGPADSAPKAIYDGLRFAHYACLLALPVALALVLHPVLARLRDARKLWAVTLLCLPAQLAVLVCALFVPIEYYAAEGFYSQIAGIYPLLLGWLFYGLIEQASSRFVLACAWLVIQRFTYGLNLADAFATLAYLTLWDASAIRPRWLRYGAFAFVPVALFTAYQIVLKLLPMRTWGGTLIHHDVPWILGAQCLLALALLTAPGVFTAAGVQVSAASLRLWRYAGTFGLVNGGLTAVYFAAEEPREYYIVKYGLYAMMLVSIAALGPVSVLVAHLFSGTLRSRGAAPTARLAFGVVAVAALASVAVARGYAPQRRLARERYQRSVPNEALFSNFEPPIDAFMQQTLRKHHATFGGYYDPHWPRNYVHNALFGTYVDSPGNTPHRTFNEYTLVYPRLPGRCYFVLGEPSWFGAPAGSPMGAALRAVKADAKTCISYVPAWGTGAFPVCAACDGPAAPRASR
jgi:hypothetical protein